MGSLSATSNSPKKTESFDMTRADIGNVRRTRSYRQQIKRQESVELHHEPYGIPSSSRTQGIIHSGAIDRGARTENDVNNGTIRRTKRTQEAARMREPEPLNHLTESPSRLVTRPNKRRRDADKREELPIDENNDSHQIFILPPPRQTISSNLVLQHPEGLNNDSSFFTPMRSSTDGCNTGGVTLPPIYLPYQHSTHGRITLPPIRSVFPIDLENYGTLGQNNIVEADDVEVIDLTRPICYYDMHAIDLTTSPSPPIIDLTSPSTSSRSSPEVIVIEDDDTLVSIPLHSADSLQKPTGLKLKCSICIDFPKDVSATPCGHIFCFECITTAVKLQKKCALCRHPVANKQIKRLEFKVL